MVDTLHAKNIHFMVSVWSKFDKNTSFYADMYKHGHILKGSIYYDPWSESAREMFYQFSKKAHFDINVDSLWLDATEPEGFEMENQSIALGSGNAYFNSYSLMTTKAIADGLRRDFSAQQGRRVFSLTRSSFAGQQRTGAALWERGYQRKMGLIPSPNQRKPQLSNEWARILERRYWRFFRLTNQYTDPGYYTVVRWFTRLLHPNIQSSWGAAT